MKKTGRNRIISDKFYTLPTIALECIQKFKKYLPKNMSDSLLIEPSAGNGAFLAQLSDSPILAFDIEPAGGNIIRQDFLQLNLDHFDKKLFFIGNPPFGRQASLARKFVKHIAKCPHTQLIAFILPKSFKKKSFQKTFPLQFHLMETWDIPDNSFTIGGNAHNVPCVFQIWQKKQKKRAVPCPPIAKYFTFVKKEGFPDFSLRRVGVYAGKLDAECASKSSQSNYFIKLGPNIPPHAFETQYKTLQFQHNNTVGAKSISKPEFILAINTLVL